MNNATAFWGTDSNGCPDNSAPTTGFKATCNGNGNGRVEDGATNTSATEEAAFWQHLANAGQIEGSYTGAYDSDGWTSTFGVNLPRSKFPNSGWYNYYQGVVTGSASWFNVDYGNVLVFAGRVPGDWTSNITPEDAWNVDKKLDDGVPGTGKVVTIKGDTPTSCTTQGGNLSDTGATYVLANTSPDCFLFFVRAY